MAAFANSWLRGRFLQFVFGILGALFLFAAHFEGIARIDYPPAFPLMRHLNGCASV
jgi:hypothetical protein